MWRLNWVCTVCLWPFYVFPGKNGLSSMGTPSWFPTIFAKKDNFLLVVGSSGIIVIFFQVMNKQVNKTKHVVWTFCNIILLFLKSKYVKREEEWSVRLSCPVLFCLVSGILFIQILVQALLDLINWKKSQNWNCQKWDPSKAVNLP